MAINKIDKSGANIEKVKKLREATGAGFKDCNLAIKESAGDLDKAVEILRVKGISKASKKMSRDAKEGVVAISGDEKKTSIIEVNCETDFVAKNDDFINFVKELSDCLDKPCAASFKHTSPAGVGTSKPLSDILKQIYDVEGMELSPLAIAFIRARNSDPMSSFGDFIALSHEVDVPTAKLIKRYISDGVVAPSYSKEALDILMSKRGGKYLIIEVDPKYENRESFCD